MCAALACSTKSLVVAAKASGGSQGQATDIQIQAERILRMKKHLNEILAANTGKDLATIQADTERDHFLSAEEAVAYGLVDKVLTRQK